MNVALVHDYLNRFGGAERVLSALAEIWSDAPIYTSVADKSVLEADSALAEKDVRTSILQKLPFWNAFPKVGVPLVPYVFEVMDFSNFDLVISTGYFAKSVLSRPNQTHVNYCNTPPRFLYGYGTETGLRRSALGQLLVSPLDHRLRVWDFCSAQRPDYIVANSENVAQRVRKFWRRRAKVIYPPVELPKDFPSNDELRARWKDLNGKFFLVVSRLETYKNVELVVQACNQLKKPLKVAGVGSELKKLRRIAGPTVEILGRVAEEELSLLYGGCRALIVAAVDEDFGLTPVEAMAYGKPVVALKSGGFRETVIPGKTGIFFEEPSVDSLIEALQKIESFYCRVGDCLSQAKKFSKEKFKSTFSSFVEKEILQESHG
ncbi:MAG: glycosyltransferase [Patescibacteria group bacterium]|nr:glycosyltransferase [Patescibacteria group bacterium]